MSTTTNDLKTQFKVTDDDDDALHDELTSEGQRHEELERTDRRSMTSDQQPHVAMETNIVDYDARPPMKRGMPMSLTPL